MDEICLSVAMWNASKNRIPKRDIDNEHMRILDEAVRDCEQDFDVRTPKVYDALEYFEQQSTRSWGFTLFRQGLEDWNVAALHEGLRLIKQHIGHEAL